MELLGFLSCDGGCDVSVSQRCTWYKLHAILLILVIRPVILP